MCRAEIIQKLSLLLFSIFMAIFIDPTRICWEDHLTEASFSGFTLIPYSAICNGRVVSSDPMKILFSNCQCASALVPGMMLKARPGSRWTCWKQSIPFAKPRWPVNCAFTTRRRWVRGTTSKKQSMDDVFFNFSGSKILNFNTERSDAALHSPQDTFVMIPKIN